jgi:hypothetical protein
MALIDAAELDGKEVARVYIAGRLAEAKRVEQVLSENGIDYALDAEVFRTNLLGFLPSEYEGVAFYVLSGQASRCRQILHGAGLTAGLVEDDEHDG